MIMKFIIFYLILIIGGCYFQDRPSPNIINESATPQIETIKTELDRKNCELLDKKPSNELFDFIIRCKGPGGFDLIYRKGLIKTTLGLIPPGKNEIPLKLWDKIKAPSHPGVYNLINWRVEKKAGKTKPIALIINAGADEGSYHTRNSYRSFLVIVKLSKTDSCITDFVSGKLKNSEKLALKLADESATKPCYFKNNNSFQNSKTEKQ